MKNLGLMLLLIAFAGTAFSQTLVLDDKTGLISEKTRAELITNLAANQIELVNEVDFSRKCDYLFVELRPEGSNDIVRLLNCKDKVLGSKNFGRDLKSASESERSVLMAVAIRNLLKSTEDTKQAPVYEEQEFDRLSNEHYTRYYFSPSSFNLRKHEFYYSTLNFGIHDIQYGITDHFSIGMGTTVAFMPVYITPKVSFSISDKHHISFGDLLAYGTYVSNWYFNLLYGTYTYGTIDKNITIGGALLHSNVFERSFGEAGPLSARPVISLAGMANVGPRLHFVSEHYYTNFSQVVTGDMWTPNFETIVYKELTYSTNTLFGFAGFRWTTKRANTLAWQIGLGYIFLLEEDISDQYNLPENEPFTFYKESFDPMFYVFPTMSFTYKFGMVVR